MSTRSADTSRGQLRRSRLRALRKQGGRGGLTESADPEGKAGAKAGHPAGPGVGGVLQVWRDDVHEEGAVHRLDDVDAGRRAAVCIR